MVQTQSMLERLCREGGEHVDIALAEALGTADAASRQKIAMRLLERKRPVGLLGLVVHFGEIPGGVQQQMLAHITELDGALRAAGEQKGVELRLKVVEIIDHARDGRLADVLSRQLHEHDSRITRAAARALMRQARRIAIGEGRRDEGTEGRSGTRKTEKNCVRGAVTEACACFHQHRRRDVLIAAACFAGDMGPTLARHVTDYRGAAHHAMCEVVGQADHPLVCRALLRFVTVGAMADSALRGLSRPYVGGHMSAVLHEGWLAASPGVRAAVRRVRSPGHLLPGGRRLSALPISAARQLPRWIDVLSIGPGSKLAALNELAGRRDAVTRLLALKELMRFGTAEADEIAAAMCFDAEGAIARIALRHLIRRRWGGLSRLMVKLISADSGGGTGLREVAERYLGPVGFEKFWANWAHLSASARLAGGRALMKIDGRFNHKLQHKTRSALADERLQAVMMIRELGQETYFEARLLELSGDGDARVASSVVKAMSELGDSQKAVDALAKALEHEDDRVKSNAIESLEAIKRVNEVQAKLEQIAEGRGNRSRATAIKALLELPMGQAMARLRKMLSDGEEKHRVSALWVVEKLGVAALVHQVAELAREDVDERVKRRAMRVLREMAEAHAAV